MEGHSASENHLAGQSVQGQQTEPRVTKLNDELIGQFDGHLGDGQDSKVVGQFEGHGADRNTVPFSHQLTQMNMADVRLSTTKRPATRRTTPTSSTTRTPTTTTSTALVTRGLNEMMVEQVLFNSMFNMFLFD